MLQPKDPEKARAKAQAWRARSKPLGRSAGLNGGKGLQSAGPLKARSGKTAKFYREQRAPHVAELIAAVRCCEIAVAAVRAGVPVGACSGALTVHERRKRSQGGSLLGVVPAPGSPVGVWHGRNTVVACWGHNGWVEDHPAEARRFGATVSPGDPEWELLAAPRGERKTSPSREVHPG